jgi:hypothetical protein
MTSEAMAASKFGRDANASAVTRRLGLVDYPPSLTTRFPTLGVKYLDVGSTIKSRDALAIEFRIMEEVRQAYNAALQLPHELALIGWVMRGAIREDDNRLETPIERGGDEPGGIFNRVFGHFFDPVVNRGLTVAGVQVGARAIDWAQQSGATVTSLPTSFANRENHYKTLDAREAMWRALTLKTAAMGDGVFPDGWTTDATGRESLRKAYWATTFRALGDVVHLVQDMAQPQHTRNDIHSGVGCVPGLGCAFGHDSYFEKHLRARTVGERQVVITEGLTGPNGESLISITPTKLDYSPYLKPLFNSYAEYFSTGTGSANSTGRGLANYSNRGFYSAGTIIGSLAGAQYPSPNPSGSGLSYYPVTPPELIDSAGSPLPPGSSMILRKGSVDDTLRGTPDNDVPLAAVGSWDQFLQQKNPGWSSHTLNHINYDAMAKLLVPRAVAYSAGLIDYFFRGQLYVAPPAEGVYALLDHGDPASNCKDTCGFTKLKVKVANATPDITPPGGTATPQAMGSGTLVAVAKFRRNRCYATDLSGEYAGASDPVPQASYYEYCVGSRPEEIVVSDAIAVSGLNWCDPAVDPANPASCANVATALGFSFPSPIPINAASLVLQMVFRGPLGSEADAVAVETVDVSEPTYLTYMNSSDYIKIGASVYTRERINIDPAQPDDRPSAASLRQAVQPQSCIVNDQLDSSCFQPFDVSFPLKWGIPVTDTVVAPLTLAQPGKFSRFAMLVPPSLAGTVSQALSPCTPRDDVPVPGQQMQERLVPDPNQPPQEGQPPNYMLQYAVMPISTVRGVNTGVGVYCVALGDGVAQAPSSTELRWMANVTGPDLTPVPATGFSFGP